MESFEMKKMVLALVIAFTVAFSSAVAAEKTWQGGASGDWNVAANWSGGVPTAEDVARFDAPATVSIGADVTVHGFVFNADVTVTDGTSDPGSGDISVSKTVKLTGGDCEVFVAEGCTATVVAYVQGVQKASDVFRKTGKGTFRPRGYCGGNGGSFASMEIESGLFLCAFKPNSDGMGAQGEITVHDGATVRMTGNNQLMNQQVFHLMKGGVLDCDNRYDSVGGFYGEGVLTNLISNTQWALSENRRFAFSGRIHGVLGLKEPEKRAGKPDYGLLIGGSNTLADAVVAIPSQEGAFLRFAPGVGTYFFKEIDPGTVQPILLEDVDGEPITLVGNFNSTLKVPLTGKGSFVHNDPAKGYNSCITNGVPCLTGAIGSRQGYLNLGTGAKGADPDFSSLSGLFTEPQGTLYFNFAEDYRLASPVWNTGVVTFGGAASPTFACYASEGGTMRAEATGVGPVTVERLYATNATVSANAKEDFCWTMKDGFAEGVSYAFAGDRDRLVFDGGENRAARISVPSSTDKGATVVFNGGRHVFTDILYGTGKTRYEVNGGEVCAMRGSLCNSDSNCLWSVSGGRLEIGSCNTWWQYGFGAEVSGSGQLVISLTNETDFAGNQDFRLASDGYSHALIIRDRGLVDIQKAGCKMMSAGASRASTGTVEVVDHGVLRMADGFSAIGTAENARTRMYFDGGTLVPTVGEKTILPKSAYHVTEVGPRGMTLDLREIPAPNGTASAYDRLVPAAGADGRPVADGGLCKRGGQQMRFFGGLGLAGTLDFFGGVACMNTEQVDDWGTGDLNLRNGYLDVQRNMSYSFASGAGSKVTYFGAPILSVKKGAGTVVTLGDPAAETPALACGEAGSVLVLQDGSGTEENNSPFDGTGACVRAGGGVPVSAASGLVIPPVLYKAYATTQTGDRFAVGPLTYDAEKGFLAAALTEGFGGGANQAAKVTGATTLAGDAAAASVSVYGIASGTSLNLDGHTLSVGDGSAAAFVFLNASSSLAQVPTIAGGVLDFGSAMGYVANNNAKGNATPNVISATIAGTKGVTFVGTATLNALSLLKLSAANTYEGDAFVRNLKISVGNAGAFSLGTVYALGDEYTGGTLCFDTANVTLANRLVLSGRGMVSVAPTYRGAGVLEFPQTAGVSGAIELADDAVFSVALTKTATLSGAISGNASVSYEGDGTFVASGANSYTGTTAVVGATLQVASDANVGAGAVLLSGRLRFANAADIVFSRPVVGEGTIELAGANVEFADLSGFRGTIVSTGAGGLDLNGKDTRMLSLDGSMTVVNTAQEAATLEITSDNTRYASGFSGTIGGNIDFVKSGANTIYLGEPLTYLGATALLDGTLVLGPLNVPTNNPVSGATLRLDASRTDTLTLQSGTVGGESVTFVTEWRDADGLGFAFANDPANVDNDVTDGTKQHWPIFRAGEDGVLGGLDTVWFDGVVGRLLSSGTSLTRRTIFAVMRPATGAHPRVKYVGQSADWSCIGLFGQSGADSGLRLNGGAWATDGWADTPLHIRSDGDEKNAFTRGNVTMASIEYAASKTVSSLAVGDYWGNGSQMRSMYGDVAEIIVYPDLLGDIARAKVEDYLMKKWGMKDFPEDTVPRKDILPETTVLTLNAPAVLDLAGSSQTLAGLYGDGTIINSSSRPARLFVVGGLKEFTGTIGENIEIIRRGSMLIIR